MAEVPNRIKEVQILGDDGAPVGGKVKISPDAKDVMVHDASDNANHASLQDFLFKKFDWAQVGDKTMRIVSTDEETGEIEYFEIDPTNHSVWQSWFDYQDMTKKRLVGIYTGDGYKNADFLLGQEADEQAEHTQTDKKTEQEKQEEINNNIESVIYQYPRIQDKKTETEDEIEKVYSDYHIPDNIQYDNGNIAWENLPETQKYSQEDKAKELMLAFGEQSFWQALIDRELENKDKLIGIYDSNGNCVGHFEATRYNIDALKKVYEKGFNIGTGAAPDENNDIKTIKWGQIETDEEAMGLLVDLSKKSIYQHLIELKDFWITLPFEEYETGIGNNYGLNIVNKNDILTLHFADNTLSEEATEEVE